MATIDDIKAHPICAEFQERVNAYVVFYPDVYKVPGGAMVKRGLPAFDAAAIDDLYAIIDSFWNAQRLQVPAH